MAYFLKKTTNKKGLYLQIYESFYDPERGHTVHKSLKPIGYVHELQAKGIDDPIAFYQEEVIKLNQELNVAKNANKARQISDNSPEKLIGYFPLKNINDRLSVKKYIDLMQTATDFRFNVFDMMSSLVYARLVHPCSKVKTYEEVIPKLFDTYDYSLNQLYDGLEYIGCEYEKIIEIYNHQIQQMYSFNTSHTYFDCTNFYFEIDREDAFRRKGPSKENKKEPIVGMGLLLDANQIPIGMKLYPGNESEKPVLRNIIDDLKTRNSISGKTIQVADKGLNCAENIIHALKSGDGYIFSKSVKLLPETEMTWFAPSISAASKRFGLIPITAAIRRIVVFPNHIRKFINATSPLVPITEDRNRIGSPMIPADTMNEFTGPLSENNAKNNIANALAIIRFGI